MNEQRVSDPMANFDPEDSAFGGKYMVARFGKKKYCLIEVVSDEVHQ